MKAQIASVSPILNTTTIECETVAGSTALTSSAGFGDIVAGMQIHGPGIPFGTVVSEVTDTSNIVMSNAATEDDASVNLQFAFLASAAYGDGDLMGMPFRLPSVVGPGMRYCELKSIQINDADQQDAAFDILLFNRPPTIDVLENAVAEIPDADVPNIVASVVVPATGYIDLGTGASVKHVGNVGIVVENSYNATRVPQPKFESDLWGVLISRGTPTYTLINSLTLKFAFATE